MTLESLISMEEIKKPFNICQIGKLQDLMGFLQNVTMNSGQSHTSILQNAYGN